MLRLSDRVVVAGLPTVVASLVVAVLVWVWAMRLGHPFDLEWMEGGMLAHAWRLQQGLPLYAPPSADFVPFIYPPGYPAVLAVLGGPIGLSPALGRAVSVAAILAAAAALAFVVRRQGGPWWLVGAAPVVFLGTYPDVGAFYDLVRPDSLGLACMAWAVALALEPRRWAPVAAGVLIVAAVMMKHNLGAVALPIGLGLALRGWRPAIAFGTTVTLGTVATIGGVQVASAGGLLTYLLRVPLSHGVRWHGGLLDSVREWGTALPVVMAAGGLGVLWLAVRQQRTVPLAVASGLPVASGMVLGWWLTYNPPIAGTHVLNGGGGLAAFALGAGVLAVPLWAVDRAMQQQLDGAGRPSERLLLGLSLAATTALLAWWMRAHQGGYVNVHAPFLWVASLGFGVGLTQLLASAGGRFVASGVVSAQLLWSLGRIHPDALIPDADDVAAGWQAVEAMRGVEGEVLSPYASWLPVYAGKTPSVHVMAVWDVDHEGGPYQESLAALDRALREQRWELVLGGTQGFRPALPRYYEVAFALHEPGDDRAMPQTGWMARPERALVPRDVPTP